MKTVIHDYIDIIIYYSDRMTKYLIFIFLNTINEYTDIMYI